MPKMLANRTCRLSRKSSQGIGSLVCMPQNFNYKESEAKVKISSKILAFLAYLLLVPGWLVVLLFFRKDQHAKFHAKQSLVLNLFVFLLLVVWFVLTWLLVGVSFIGPLLAWFAFAIVIFFYIYALIAWITGMLRAFQPKAKPLALVGTWAAKLPF